MFLTMTAEIFLVSGARILDLRARLLCAPYPRQKQIDQVRDGALNHTTTPVEWISLKTSGYL
jgi:hypothetical protein